MVLFLHNTSRVNDEPYPTLLRDKGFTGFPSLAFMDADGKIIARQRARNVPAFEQTLTEVGSFLELKAKVEEGDKTLLVELILKGFGLGSFEFEEAKALCADLEDVTDEQREQVDSKLLDLEVTHLDKQMRTRQMDQAEVARRFAEMAKAGRIPTTALGSFWQGVRLHADTTEDVKLYEQSLEVLKEMGGSNPRNAAIIQRWEQRLKELKGGS